MLKNIVLLKLKINFFFSLQVSKSPDTAPPSADMRAGGRSLGFRFPHSRDAGYRK